MKKKVIKILNIVVDVIVVLILIASVLVMTVSLMSDDDGVPNVFGKAYMNVKTESMEPTIKVNDLIICDVVDDADAEYEVDDIVTFKQQINGNVELNTHRIVAVVNSKGKPFNPKKDDIKYYQTQGDNNDIPDDALKTADEILAVYTGAKIPFVGYLRTPEGFFWVILLPMILFFLYEAVRVVINIVAYNKEKALIAAQEVINSSDLTEEQKQKAIAEYLAAQGKAPPKDEKTDDEAKTEAVEEETPVEETAEEETPAEETADVEKIDS